MVNETVTLYGPAFSNYVRSALLCCEEKGIPYRLEEKMSGRELAHLNNPFQRVPILKHNDFVLFETAAICRYLDRAFAGPMLSPSNIEQLARMDQWISAANAYFDSTFIRSFVLECAFPKGEDGKPDRAKIDSVLPQVHRQLGIIDQALQEQPYFSGPAAGIADFLIIPMIDYLTGEIIGSNLLSDTPAALEYWQRMKERESCKKILVSPLKR